MMKYQATAFLAEPAVKTALFEVPGAIA